MFEPDVVTVSVTLYLLPVSPPDSRTCAIDPETAVDTIVNGDAVVGVTAEVDTADRVSPAESSAANSIEYSRFSAGCLVTVGIGISQSYLSPM